MLNDLNVIRLSFKLTKVFLERKGNITNGRISEYFEFSVFPADQNNHKVHIEIVENTDTENT